MRGVERQAAHYSFADSDLADVADAATARDIPADSEVESMLRGPSITQGMNKTR